MIDAQQVLGSGQVLDVTWTPIDPLSAVYSLSLRLVFGAEASVAGKYNIVARAPGYTGQSTAPAVVLGAARGTTSKDLVLVP